MAAGEVARTAFPVGAEPAGAELAPDQRDEHFDDAILVRSAKGVSNSAVFICAAALMKTRVRDRCLLSCL